MRLVRTQAVSLCASGSLGSDFVQYGIAVRSVGIFRVQMCGTGVIGGVFHGVRGCSENAVVCVKKFGSGGWERGRGIWETSMSLCADVYRPLSTLPVPNMGRHDGTLNSFAP